MVSEATAERRRNRSEQDRLDRRVVDRGRERAGDRIGAHHPAGRTIVALAALDLADPADQGDHRRIAAGRRRRLRIVADRDQLAAAAGAALGLLDQASQYPR